MSATNCKRAAKTSRLFSLHYSCCVFSFSTFCLKEQPRHHRQTSLVFTCSGFCIRPRWCVVFFAARRPAGIPVCFLTGDLPTFVCVRSRSCSILLRGNAVASAVASLSALTCISAVTGIFFFSIGAFRNLQNWLAEMHGGWGRSAHIFGQRR